MRTRFALVAAATLLLSSSTSAQNLSGRLQPITSPVKDAGTYHLSTGTWTRAKSSVALAGPEVLYDNTCTVGFFTGVDPWEVIGDSGRIPSISSGGLYDDYTVSGFEFAYCSYETGRIGIALSFWDCYQACDEWDLPSLIPSAGFSLLSMPAGGPSGSQGCWVVSIDLLNTTLAFDLGGDCNGNFDNVGSTDSFGWGWTFPAGTTGTIGSGPQLAGDPAQVYDWTCGGVGDGTTFAGFNPALAGTGIGNIDQFQIYPPGDPSGGFCYWFGGYSGSNGSGASGLNPWSGFYLELQGDLGTSLNTGTATCDGSGGSCPCSALSGIDHGCPNSNPNGLGAKLVGSGNPDTTHDSFILSVSDAAIIKPGIVLSGKVDLSPGIATIPDSAGLLCVGTQTLRASVVVTDANGAASLPDFQGQPYGQASNVTPGTLTVYTFWFRDPGTACAPNDTPASDFNFSNAWAVTWL